MAGRTGESEQIPDPVSYCFQQPLRSGRGSADSGMVIRTKPFRTDIIVLRDIDVVSRHKETKKILPWMPPRDVYKLIISNANGAIFEHDFHDEKILDTILPYIQKKKRDR